MYAAHTCIWFKAYILRAGYGDYYALNQLYLPIVDFALCNRPDVYDGDLTDTMVCAGWYPSYASACYVSDAFSSYIGMYAQY